MLFYVVELVCWCWVCGLCFNYLEVIVVIVDYILEGVCDGCIVVELMVFGCEVFGCDDVMEGVLEMFVEV